jgi:hypothetical protein
MKLAFAASVLCLAVSSSMVGAFSPSLMQSSSLSQRKQSSVTQLSAAAVVTGAKGKPASSKEEDLALTLAIILDHEARSSTVSKEQMIQQVEAAAAAETKEATAPVEEEKIDVSIPYDAAARLAFAASGSKLTFEEFEVQYIRDTVEMVRSKSNQTKATTAAPAKVETVDISVPYDAAARLAYEASGSKLAFEEFEVQYKQDTVNFIKSKQPVDVSIPYDAAAKLAYDQDERKSKMDFNKYLEIYREETVAMIKSKQPVDISIPYDAAAKLAYYSSDKSIPFEEFEAQYKAEAVALVKSKQ